MRCSVFEIVRASSGPAWWHTGNTEYGVWLRRAGWMCVCGGWAALQYCFVGDKRRDKASMENRGSKRNRLSQPDGQFARPPYFSFPCNNLQAVDRERGHGIHINMDVHAAAAHARAYTHDKTHPKSPAGKCFLSQAPSGRILSFLLPTQTPPTSPPNFNRSCAALQHLRHDPLGRCRV